MVRIYNFPSGSGAIVGVKRAMGQNEDHFEFVD